ncbi:MAG TPA: DUF2147 domain-containing protein [Bacteroidales bacterium]|nr:DUF2147 domain-containing protein [Bacteroidales bacterium]
MKYKRLFFKEFYYKLPRIIIALIIYGSLVSYHIPLNKQDEIIGKWLMPDNLEIEMFKKDNLYFGKIVGLEGFNNGQTKDYQNPDKSKRNENLLGKVIIYGLKFDPYTQQWVNGKIYAPQKGITLDLVILKISNKTLEAKGSKLFFSKTILWTRRV